ncbi:unnamed protein product [Urochloa humidicola]
MATAAATTPPWPPADPTAANMPPTTAVSPSPTRERSRGHCQRHCEGRAGSTRRRGPRFSRATGAAALRAAALRGPPESPHSARRRGRYPPCAARGSRLRSGGDRAAALRAPPGAAVSAREEPRLLRSTRRRGQPSPRAVGVGRGRCPPPSPAASRTARRRRRPERWRGS